MAHADIEEGPLEWSDSSWKQSAVRRFSRQRQPVCKSEIPPPLPADKPERVCQVSAVLLPARAAVLPQGPARSIHQPEDHERLSTVPSPGGRAYLSSSLRGSPHSKNEPSSKFSRAPSNAKSPQSLRLRAFWKHSLAATYFPTRYHAVSSAMEGLTTGFGMGPGVPPPPWPPRKFWRTGVRNILVNRGRENSINC